MGCMSVMITRIIVEALLDCQYGMQILAETIWLGPYLCDASAVCKGLKLPLTCTLASSRACRSNWGSSQKMQNSNYFYHDQQSFEILHPLY